jgi:carbon-monoxide dehydrogenase medium subunit
MHRALPDARPLAGGLDLLDELKWGADVAHVIELRHVRDLHKIDEIDGDILIGAMATHDVVANHPLIRRYLPDIAALWDRIGNPRIRFTGTLGGNLKSARPHYDIAPALLAVGARVGLADTAHDILLGGLPTHALLTHVLVPIGVRLLVARDLHPSVSVYLGVSPDGTKRIAVGGAHAQPPCVIIPDDNSDAQSLAQRVAESIPATLSDTGASAVWRTRMIATLTARLLREMQ